VRLVFITKEQNGFGNTLLRGAGDDIFDTRQVHPEMYLGDAIPSSVEWRRQWCR
jgi:hypothetical protein